MKKPPMHPLYDGAVRAAGLLLICLFTFPQVQQIAGGISRALLHNPGIEEDLFCETALLCASPHAPSPSASAPFPAPPEGPVTMQAPISGRPAPPSGTHLINMSADYVFKRRETLYDPIIRKTAARHGVEESLIKAIIMAESGYDPKAVSRRGARGLMQLMPGTARELGVEDVFSPDQNIAGGVKYIRDLIMRFDGNTRHALAAYHAGPRKVRKYQGVPPFKTTQAYIRKILRYQEIYRHHADARALSAALTARMDEDFYRPTAVIR